MRLRKQLQNRCQKFFKVPTLLRGGFVLLGILIEAFFIFFSINYLYKSLQEFYLIIVLSIIYWLFILFVRKISNSLLHLCLFLFPFNRFLILRDEQAYLLGRVSDYLLITLHIFEIPLYTLFAWEIYQNLCKGFFFEVIRRFLKNFCNIHYITREKDIDVKAFLKKYYINVLFIMFLMFFTLSSLINETSIFIVIPYVQLVTDFVLFYYFLTNYSDLKIILNIFYFSSFIQFLISISQIVLNRSVGLYFLGESVFNNSLFYIAKAMFSNTLRVRAYGTFPHPNLLGAFMLISISLCLYDLFTEIFKKESFSLNWNISLKVFILTCSIITLYLTQSRTAILALILAILVLIFVFLIRLCDRKFVLKVFFPIILFSFISFCLIFQNRIFSLFTYDQSSVSNRIELADIAIDSVRNDFASMFVGNGPGGFLRYLSENKPVKTYYSFIVEPVHNIFLLFLSDLGILGLIIWMLFFLLLITKSRLQKISLPYSTFKSIVLIFLLLSCNLDHFLVTLKQGIFLFAIIVFVLNIHFSSSKQRI